jgi:hypothetical protein
MSPNGEPVESILAAENAGEFPTQTDQGEETGYPSAASNEMAAKPTLQAPAPKRSRKR